MHCNLLPRVASTFYNDISSTSFDQSAAIKSFGWKYSFASFYLGSYLFFGFGCSWEINIFIIFAINSILWVAIPRRFHSSITSSRLSFVDFLIYTCPRRSDVQWAPFGRMLVKHAPIEHVQVLGNFLHKVRYYLFSHFTNLTHCIQFLNYAAGT